MISKAAKRWLGLLIPGVALIGIAGCFLFPQAIKYQAILTPTEGQKASREEAQYVSSEDGTISYEIPGLRIEVKPMTDDELNQMFPDESTRGKYSTNAYTYGDWVDPRLGFTPNRFSVFKVTIYNRTYPKVMLDPSEVKLETNRGQYLQSYGISAAADQNNFENYYRSRRGQSGNEFYRFELRMGAVRSYNFEEEQPVFKGENYGGFIVFDPVEQETETVHLTLKDFTFRFGAFDNSIDSEDLKFTFKHKIEKSVVEKLTGPAVEVEQLMVTESGPSRVLGNLPDDRTRSVSAIQAVARQRLNGLNRCFTSYFDKGEAQEGRVVVNFTIEVGGAISETRVTESTVDNDEVSQCIRGDVLRWSLRPIDIAGLQAARSQASAGAGAIDGPALGGAAAAASVARIRVVPVTVTYPFEFRVPAAK